VYAAESALAPPAATPTLVTSHKQVLPAEIASLQWDLKSDRLVRAARRQQLMALMLLILFAFAL